MSNASQSVLVDYIRLHSTGKHHFAFRNISSGPCVDQIVCVKRYCICMRILTTLISHANVSSRFVEYRHLAKQYFRKMLRRLIPVCSENRT